MITISFVANLSVISYAELYINYCISFVEYDCVLFCFFIDVLVPQSSEVHSYSLSSSHFVLPFWPSQDFVPFNGV